jgi:hypothetical protein
VKARNCAAGGILNEGKLACDHVSIS